MSVPSRLSRGAECSPQEQELRAKVRALVPCSRRSPTLSATNSPPKARRCMTASHIDHRAIM